MKEYDRIDYGGITYQNNAQEINQEDEFKKM